MCYHYPVIFRSSTAGRHWEGWEPLAALCEQAALSVDQAEAARLGAGQLSYVEIAQVLSTLRGEPVSYSAARRKAREAEARLKRARPDLVARQRQETVALLKALRNVRSCAPRLAIYRERWWGHDREPVTFVSRLDGELPEDLTRQPLRFLRDLPRLLERRAVRL